VKWFPLDDLPFDKMWEDDLLWIPLMLRGVRFDAIFTYDAANRRVIGFAITSR
jgi:8-oxo-dGTP diphosphatase